MSIKLLRKNYFFDEQKKTNSKFDLNLVKKSSNLFVAFLCISHSKFGLNINFVLPKSQISQVSHFFVQRNDFWQKVDF